MSLWIVLGWAFVPRPLPCRVLWQQVEIKMCVVLRGRGAPSRCSVQLGVDHGDLRTLFPGYL